MFGYIKVHKEELLVREYEGYKAAYCSLCKQLGKDYSFLARFILSYDCAFYGMLLMALDRSCSGFERKSCVCNPFKKCTYCKTDSDALSKAAALSVISSYYKLLDDIQDSSFWKRCLYKIIKPIFSIWRKKASKIYPYLDDVVKMMVENQFEIEAKENSCLDEACEPTAKMLGDILSVEGRTEAEKRVLHQIGYGLGRFIYLADAVDDYKKDLEKQRFNPFVKIQGDKYQLMKNNLSQALAMTFDAYNLLDITDFSGIIDNIITKGLPMVENEVLKKVKGEI